MRQPRVRILKSTLDLLLYTALSIYPRIEREETAGKERKTIASKSETRERENGISEPLNRYSRRGVTKMSRCGSGAAREGESRYGNLPRESARRGRGGEITMR